MEENIQKILDREKELYIPHIRTFKNKFMAWFTHCEEYQIYKFMCALRISEFYKEKNKIKYVLYMRKANRLGEKLGYFIAPGVLGQNVKLFHRSTIIVNTNSKIGNGCMFHGDNCVGNNGRDNKCPRIGNNVELGIGAKVIGDVELADNIIVGANAVVTKSFLEPGITVAGIPAKKIK